MNVTCKISVTPWKDQTYKLGEEEREEIQTKGIFIVVHKNNSCNLSHPSQDKVIQVQGAYRTPNH
jgi:hypothetical protein